jgi:PAS domain S-box-containing protein
MAPSTMKLSFLLTRLRPIRAPGLVFAALALAVPAAFGLDPAEKPENYSVAHWDSGNGLPHNSIRQILQTRDGYLWIGTYYGLARFDGLNFTVFQISNTPALQSEAILSLAETRDGSLWIGTANGLVRHHAGRFTRYDRSSGLKSDTINTVCVAPDGSLWIGGREGISRWVDGKFVNDLDTTGIDLLGMRNITADRQGTMWVAYGNGVLRYKNGVFTRYGTAQGLPGNATEIVSVDADGRILAVTQGGLFRLEAERFVPMEQNAALLSTRLSRTILDREGNLWIGSVGGLDRMVNGRVASSAELDGHKLGIIDSLLEDREGSLWVGASTGLYRITDRRAFTMSEEQGVVANLVNVVQQTRDGSLWIAGWSSGVVRLHAGAVTRYTAGAPLTSDNITCIYESPDGTLWLGNRTSSLDRLQDGKVTTYVLQSGVASSRPVTALLMDEDGTLLIGIANRGLLRLKDDRIEPVPEIAHLSQDRSTVHALHRTKAGRLLMGTNVGLFERRADRSWHPVNLPGVAGSLNVRDFHEEAEGTLWLATQGRGLVRWQGGRARSYDTKAGLNDARLFSVIGDDRGNLWVTSVRGISRLRRSDLDAIDQGKLGTVNLLHLGRSDGLVSTSAAESGSPRTLLTTDGRLLFATTQGVAVVDPRRLQVNREPPPVVVESLLADDQPVALDGTTRLAAGTGRLEIRYTALSFTAPERMRFRYMLEGSDPRWIEAEHQRRAYYTNLAPGSYTFRVLASNSDGIWSETGAALPFILLPHYYQTLWFRLAAAGMFAGLLALGYWLRVRQLHHRQAELARRNVELDQRVEERTAALKLSQENAALEHARFKFIFDSMPVGITLASERLDGTRLRLINDAHVRICGLTREQLDEPGIFERISHPEDYPRQLALMRQLDQGGISQFSIEKRYLRPDGQIVWVVLTRLRLSYADGNRDYLTSIVDITARKQAEQELAEINRALVGLSRTAGMAEVATGVLHNVGNVLNSVNISAGLIAAGLRDSKADSLARLSALLEEHRGDFATFLTTDRKGQRLPELVASLARYSLEERDRMLGETNSLQANIDHIKAIVSMQQTYATAISLAEPLDPARLMEDALRMQQDALSRHHIRIERDYQPAGTVFADKARVLQIIINLISNARTACGEGGAGDKVITLSVRPGPDRRVRLLVRDNGIGIPAENLNRIFAHGFTTHAAGHGFGLQSAANAAREMQGSLTVTSDGPDTGATFTLELPGATAPEAAPARDAEFYAPAVS